MKGGYDAAHFANLFAVEDRHFWFRARNRIIGALAREATADFAPGYRVLEVGCGDGNVLRSLEQSCARGSVFGMDYFAEGLQYARQRVACSLVQGDIRRSPFGKAFHFIGIFDVLEHLPDDLAILQSLWQMLDFGGKLLLTVPAYQSLWSDFDEASGHCRRYEREDLAAKLKTAGFSIQQLTPFMASLYPLLRLGRRAHKSGEAREINIEQVVKRDLRVIPGVNEALLFLLFQESRWLRRGRSLPVGTSLLALAQKGRER